MLAQIKLHDHLTGELWSQLSTVTTAPDGTQFDLTGAVQKAYKHLKMSTPVDGVYCIATQTDTQKTPHHFWFKTIEGACVFALHESVVKQARNVWYATSSYTDEPEVNKYGNPSRATKNVVGVQSLWVDLDVTKPLDPAYDGYIRALALRADKATVIASLATELQPVVTGMLKEIDKYDSQEGALRDLVKFVQATGLQPTSVVSSGRGIHAYWRLDDVVTANAWRQLADSFKLLTVEHGLKADPMRTADAASLMRLPGTWHRKGEPCEVFTVQENTTSYGYGAISTLVHEKLRLANPRVVANMRDKHAPVGVAAALIRPSDFPPASAELVATKCQQVKFFRQSKGIVDEPVWYLLAGTLGHCVEGESYFQKWSSGHPDYTEAATQEKLDQWMERATGPSSCAAFESKNPTGCAGCPHKGKIAYPVQLGVEAAPMIDATQAAASAFEVNIEATLSSGTVLPAYSPPIQIGNFRRTTAGIQVVDDSLPAPITICDYDVWVTRISLDKFTKKYVATVNHKDDHGEVYEKPLELAILTDPKQVLVWLYSCNIIIKPDHAKAMSAYIQEMVRDMNKHVKTIPLHAGMGWAVEMDTEGREKGTIGFVLGHKMYTKDGVHEAGISPRIREVAKEFHATGDSARWTAATRIFQQKGLEPQAFAMLLGFGAPLMRFHADLHAPIVSLLGETGAGKTSVAQFAQSIYGKAGDMMIRWSDTELSKYARISSMSNLPVLIDECTEADAETLAKLTYNISQGKERSRLRSDSSIMTGVAKPWSTIVMMTTNESFYEKMSSLKSDTGAMSARVLEYRIEYNDAWMDFCGDELKELLHRNYGGVGEKYIEWIVANEYLIKPMLTQAWDMIVARAQGRKHDRYWFGCISSAIVGGLIAKYLGLIDFDVQTVVEWSIKLLTESKQKAIVGVVRPIEMIGNFVAESNGKIVSFGKTVNGVSQLIGAVPNGSAYIRFEDSLNKVYIRKDTLDKWLVARRMNAEGMFRTLVNDGVVSNTTARINILQNVPGAPPSTVVCYVFTASALAAIHPDIKPLEKL